MPAATRSRALLDATLDVETPEQVVVSYTLAGIGTRGAAALIDLLIMFVLIGTLWYGTASLPKLMPGLRDFGGGWLTAVIILGQFLIIWGYFVAFEAIWDGQTPGKRALGLRVVRNGGGGVDIGASAARNVIRFVDFLPLGYFVGMVSVIANSRNQRLGDLVAGTIVVRERLLRTTRPTPVDDAELSESDRAAMATLDDERFALLDRFIAREATLDAASRTRLATALSQRLNRDGADDPIAALRALHQSEMAARRNHRPTTSAAGARREEWAVVAEGRPRWDAFSTLLTEVRRRGLGTLGEDEVTAFVESYREVATDLARLRTADRGRGGDAVFMLSRLVSAGHNLLYRRPTQGIVRVAQFMAFDVPREIRRSWRYVLVASALLFVPAVGTIVAIVRQPALAERMLPAGMIERAEEGQQRGQTGADYLPNGEDERGSALSAFLMTNNIKVALMAFAGGITAGVLTVFALVFNGIAALGAGVGLYITKGIGAQILGFVAAHGVLELSAICISGAAGFLIATGILMPGDRTRREALVENGARSLHLVACVVLFLILAGLIEGNISPSKLPDSAKYATSVITAIWMGWYLSLGRDREENAVVAPTTRRVP